MPSRAALWHAPAATDSQRSDLRRRKTHRDRSGETEEENGTYIFFEPDPALFLNYRFHAEFIETMLRNYTYLNTGLAIFHNGRRIISRNGLEDLLTDNMTSQGLYPIVHLKGETSTSRLHPYRAVWRGILLFRQRTAHHAGRNAPKCLQGTHRAHHQGVFRQELRRAGRA